MVAMNDLAPAEPVLGGGGRAGRSGAEEATGVEVRPAATVMLVRDAPADAGMPGPAEDLASRC